MSSVTPQSSLSLSPMGGHREGLPSTNRNAGPLQIPALPHLGLGLPASRAAKTRLCGFCSMAWGVPPWQPELTRQKGCSRCDNRLEMER